MKLTYSNIRSVLENCGPLTMREVAKFFPDEPYYNVGSMISAMRIRLVNKQIYIHSWTRDGIGRKYLRAVYALGDKRDAKKPPVLSDKERSTARREKKKIPKGLINSVFNWQQE